MPNRGKRTLEDFDPLKSDSADSTYSASAARPTRTKSSKTPRGKPARKRQRRAYGADGSDEISENSEVSEESYEGDRAEEEIEIDERTGRPKRKATKKRVVYQESDGDSAEFLEAVDSEAEEEPPAKKQRKDKRSLVLKLNVRTPQPTPAPARRSTRARSGSVVTKRRSSPSEMASGGTRRSSRIAHDESETIVALTDSGRHADIIRPGTRSPEGIPPRALKGGKGIKSLPATAIVEEEEDSSARTKEEPEDQSQRREIVTAGTVEVASSRGDPDEDSGEQQPMQKPNVEEPSLNDTQELTLADAAVIPESGGEGAAGEEDDEEDLVRQPRRATRHTGVKHEDGNATAVGGRLGGRSLRRALRLGKGNHSTQSSQRRKKGGQEESSDFEPGVEEGGEEDVSDSEASASSPRKASQLNDDDHSSNSRRNGRLAKGKAKTRRGPPSDDHDSEEAEELAEELEDLQPSRSRRGPRSEILFDDKPQTRKRKPVDYRILRPDLVIPMDDDQGPSASTPSRRTRGGTGGAWQRPMFSTYGPFGGAGGPPPVFGGPGGIGAAGGVDSDSSDDETQQRPRTTAAIGGTVGMTPTSGVLPAFGHFSAAQAHGADPVQGPSGTPANLGRIKDKHALADVDPLGVDQNVNFDSVGGLQGHIDQLKEMVALPLLYPEVFQRFHVTPPRGVLFHGPPGTGKTLLARALASSVSSQGRKVTFYMRKGADALSKWVGEAERQLRLLFDEARKTQPSIIFFDEIDGLAPVRSSKQEQIHASIVSTLLALMDGMDGRGQVIVIGATNRPDSIDPALRRPGRFDREFYFPLPNTEARRAILDIHTKGWEPPLPHALKDELADLTKGYGGADLRALCTEAALNAVQRRYPQIYKSNEKLQIDPKTITITAKDFMISVKRMVPSSERSTSSGAAPLPKHVEPLLRHPFSMIKHIVADILPQKKRLTALEEAQFEDAEDDKGMNQERMQQEFERSRVFRPRLLIRGVHGMGQQYLAGALLNHFEGLHVQSFDLPTLLSDSTRSPEAAVVQLFAEVRRHKPSVIYIPNVDAWYRTVGATVISTFLVLLRTLAPTDPVLLLGILESEEAYVDQQMIKDLFGFSRRNQFLLMRPEEAERREYFRPVAAYLIMSPEDFPEPENRKKRRIEELLPAPPEPPKAPEPPSKAEMRAQKLRDRQTLNMLKLRIHPIMDQIKQKFKKFRTGVIDENQIRYLYEEEDPNTLSTDLPEGARQQIALRPYEKGTDDHGEEGLIERASGRFFYNLEIVTIEKRLSNGYYKRPKDFVADIKKLAKDAKASDDQDRLLKANELLSNVEVDMLNIEFTEPAFAAECESVYTRELAREKERVEKLKRAAAAEGREPELLPSNVPPNHTQPSNETSSGPIVLGQPLTNGVSHHSIPPLTPFTPLRPSQHSTLTNGVSSSVSNLTESRSQLPQSNGSSGPSHGEGDAAHMTNSEDGPSTERGTQDSSFGPSAQTRPLHSYTGGPASLQQRRSLPGSLSQRSAITPMAEGSHVRDYTNDASTTSSDKARISGSSGPFNTQSSQGKAEGPDLAILLHSASANSQLPDTQEFPLSQGSGGPDSIPNSSQSLPNSQHNSSQPPVPAFNAPARQPQGSIHSLLNDEPLPTSTAVTKAHPLLVADRVIADTFLEELVDRTSGCSVEQLEQIYSALTDYVWKTRGDWNRIQVAGRLRALFSEVLEDMQEMRDFLPATLEDEARARFG